MLSKPVKQNADTKKAMGKKIALDNLALNIIVTLISFSKDICG